MCLTFPSKSSRHHPITYDFLDFDRSFFLTFRVLCSDTHCTLILLSPKYSMATYFHSDYQSKKDYTNMKKVLDDALPGYAASGGTFKRPVRRYGRHVFTHNTTFPCVKQPPAVRRMPTTPSITCGRSYGTIITFCYQIISKIGPHACRQSRKRTAEKNSIASSRSLRKSSIKMSFVPRGSSTSDINRPTVR